MALGKACAVRPENGGQVRELRRFPTERAIEGKLRGVLEM